MTKLMTKEEVFELIESCQLGNGAFPSSVHFFDDCYEDSNAFITALVLRHSRNLGLSDALPEVFQKAISFLRQCESSRYPGMYFFWPEGAHPFWMGSQRLCEDADDSTIISMQLVLHQIETKQYLINLALKVLEQHRYFCSNPAAEVWQKSGVFLTWLHFLENPNPVDCCVNTNIVALLAFCNLKSMPGYYEACRMLNTVIPGTDGSAEALVALSPYYPHPIELFFALKYAAGLGADVKEALSFLYHQTWLQDCIHTGIDVNLPVCSHQEGVISWTSEILQTIRNFEIIEDNKDGKNLC